jgi:CBS domain containing-hemolysin-like protein
MWFLIVLLLLLDLLFTAVRGSLLNARLPALMDMGDDFPEKVQFTMELLDKPRLRTSLRLGAVLVHFLLGGMAVLMVVLQFSSLGTGWKIGLVVGAALLLQVVEHLLEGALLPQAERWALRFAKAARGLDIVFSPLSAVMMRLLGSPTMLEQRMSPVTEYELRNWVDNGEVEGSLDEDERQMIYSIFHFGETLCREIMIPRIDMVTMEINAPLEEAIQTLIQSGHSRVPVYEDTIDNIIGLLYSKDLLKVRQEGQSLAMIRSLLRPPYFVPEAKKVDDLLDEMQGRRIHVAVVVDEYGGVAGLVTLEDIVEEIVGEIRDEYDQAEELKYTQVGPGEYIFNARIDLEEVNQLMDSHITKDIADTLGGLVYGLVGQAPAVGVTVEVEGLTLQVEQVTGRRIRKVRARRLLTEQEKEAEAKEHDSEQ